MIRLLLALYFCWLSATCYGQKIRFTDTSNKWCYNVKYIDAQPRAGSEFTSREYFITDTTINNRRYKRLIYGLSLYKPPLCLREDTIASRIYFLNPDQNNREEIFFDYNWNIGDTIKWFLPSPANPLPQIISSVDSVLIGNISHKVFHTSRGRVFIEGILSSFDTRMLYLNGKLSTYELCSFENNVRYPYVAHINTGNQHSCCPTNIKGIKYSADAIRVFPQPAFNQVSLELPIDIDRGVFIITDNFGHVVFKRNIAEEKHIEIKKNFSQGIYFYRITDNTTNTVYSGKLVFSE